MRAMMDSGMVLRASAGKARCCSASLSTAQSRVMMEFTTYMLAMNSSKK